MLPTRSAPRKHYNQLLSGVLPVMFYINLVSAEAGDAYRTEPGAARCSAYPARTSSLRALVLAPAAGWNAIQTALLRFGESGCPQRRASVYRGVGY